MPYTTEEGGRLNNFANEPKIYQAEPLDKGQVRNYVLLGIGAAGLIGGLLYVAVAVSSLS